MNGVCYICTYEECILPVYSHRKCRFYIIYRLPRHMHIHMVDVVYARMKGACCPYMLPIYAHMNGELHIVYRLPRHMRIRIVDVVYAHINSACCLYMLPVYAHMNGAFSIVYRLPKHRRIWMVYVISAHTNGGNVFFFQLKCCFYFSLSLAPIYICYICTYEWWIVYSL